MASTEIYVSDRDELLDALKAATGGETIRLAPGNYGDITITAGNLKASGGAFDPGITITADDPADPPVIEQLDARGVSNMTFDGLIFDNTLEPGDTKTTATVFIRDHKGVEASNVAIVNCTVQGDPVDGSVGSDPNDPAAVEANGGLAEGYYAGLGIRLMNVSDITLDNNDISGHYRGIAVENADGLTVQDNYVHDIRSDAMAFGEVQDALIENNTIANMVPWRHEDASWGGDHPDMIQFWTSNSAEATENVVIRGNVMMQSYSGEGTMAQGIFMRNPKAEKTPNDDTFYYRNITIEDNVIYNSHVNTIYVGETHGLTIADNTLFHNQDRGTSTNTTPNIRLNENSTGVTVTGNTLPEITWQLDRDTWPDAWVITGNTLTEVVEGESGLEVVSDGEVITSYDALETLFADSIARAAGQSSYTTEEYYDGRGTRHVSTIDDRGTVVETTSYDEAGNFSWHTLTTQYDRDGNATVETLMRDNGLIVETSFTTDGLPVQQTFYDTSDVMNYSVRERAFDEDGSLSKEYTYVDNGTATEAYYGDTGQLEARFRYDPQDTASWVTMEETFHDSTGKRASILTMRDNGKLQYSTFDESGARASKDVIEAKDAAAWLAAHDSRSTEFYTLDDASGALIPDWDAINIPFATETAADQTPADGEMALAATTPYQGAPAMQISRDTLEEALGRYVVFRALSQRNEDEALLQRSLGGDEPAVDTVYVDDFASSESSLTDEEQSEEALVPVLEETA
ncbi:MAG: right-handed parallel beta-helix repeat-containing protein [Pseudomonadota bacterium]